MKKRIIFLLLLITNVFVYSQNYQLNIRDSITKKNIPLASVKYLDSNSGTFSDENGYVEIVNNVKRIKVSCIGYNEKTHLLSQVDSIIYLEPKEEKLEEVILLSNSSEGFKKIKSKQKITFKTNNEGFVFLKKINLTKKSKLLKIKFDIQNDSIKKNLLLKIHNVDNDNKPGEQVLYTHYYSTIEPSQRNVNLDLSDENLTFDSGTIYIALIITSNLQKKTKLEIGINPSKNQDSYFKPYYSKKEALFELPKRGKKFNSFNIQAFFN